METSRLKDCPLFQEYAKIATYMGGEYKTDLPYTFTKAGWFNTPANSSKFIAQVYDFKYKDSYDWLMPVVKKIYKDFEEIKKNVNFSRETAEIQGFISLICFTCSIQELYEIVVKAIEILDTLNHISGAQKQTT